eukprot:363837-Chlamydomonas_euryale.AAC.6
MAQRLPFHIWHIWHIWLDAYHSTRTKTCKGQATNTAERTGAARRGCPATSLQPATLVDPTASVHQEMPRPGSPAPM